MFLKCNWLLIRNYVYKRSCCLLYWLPCFYIGTNHVINFVIHISPRTELNVQVSFITFHSTNNWNVLENMKILYLHIMLIHVYPYNLFIMFLILPPFAQFSLSSIKQYMQFHDFCFSWLLLKAKWHLTKSIVSLAI